MEMLKFYDKDSIIRLAGAYLVGNSLYIVPGIPGLYFGDLRIVGAGYLLLGGVVAFKKTRELVVRWHDWNKEFLRRFKLSREISEKLRLILERRKLVFIEEKEKQRGKKVIIEEIIEFPSVLIKKDGYNYYFDFKMLLGQVEGDWERNLNGFAHGFNSRLVRADVDRGVVRVVLNHTQVNATEVPYKFDDKHDICLGYYPNGKLNWEFDEFPHMLVNGETGSGKSTFIRNILIQFRPDWHMKIIDGKLVEFDFMRRLGFDVADEGEEVDYIEKTAEVLQQRLRIMKEHEVNMYTEVEGLKPYFLIIDELAVVAGRLSGKKEKGISERERVFKLLEDVSARGRAAGVQLMLITQRPDSTYMPTFVRDNIQGKVSLGKSSKTGYTMCFGEDGKELQKLDKGLGYAVVEKDIEMFGFTNYSQKKYVEDLKFIYKRKDAKKLEVISNNISDKIS